ncbi:phage tail protein [Sodalis sp.]|uniref:phage tail protein n=1 Tax=Sodalis sp. (in: enterobacteria) TaxID=1898979 RepID=UPI0038735FE7
MSIKFFGILTHQGAARLANAAALGTKLDLSTMAVGDGGGSLPFPEPTQTALKGERRRAALNHLSIDPLNGNQIIAEQVIPENEGGWWIREMGLFDKDGTLIAVANCPESYKPQMQQGSGRTQTIRMILIVNSTEELALKIDPSIVLATRHYVDDGVIEVKAYADKLMATHTHHADPHPQYAPKDSPVFTGTPTAPTAKANDNSTQLATTAFVQARVEALTLPAASLTKTGIVQLSSAITSDSETMATTPKAVKVLADKKLSKAANGADIPNKIQFRENLGLLAPRFATFVNSGVFTVPEGVTTLYVSGCGAGGGGGGGLGYLNGYTVGGGGGAGQAVIRQAIAVTPGEELKIDVGISGKGGAGGAHNNSGIVGGDGGLTALGDLLTLPGGTGGPAGVGGTNGYGGAGYPYGETAIGGNLKGMSTFYLTAASGASCAFGGGGPGRHVGSQGAHHARPAYGYGAGGGGGGGTRIAGTAGGNGGDGVGGLLMLEW